jgi:hypothetical protein
MIKDYIIDIINISLILNTLLNKLKLFKQFFNIILE